MSGNVKYWFCLLLVLLDISAYSEMRMWTAPNGKRFEAEFVKELFETVFLNTPDGKERTLDVGRLVPQDLDYIRTMVTPEVDISFSTKSERKERSIYARPDDDIQIITGTIEVRKDRYPPYLGTLTAEVFMIGREIATPDVYVLLGRQKESFTLTREQDDRHIFTVTVEARRYREYNDQTRGVGFFGYMILVRDQTGKLAAMKTNISWITNDKVDWVCKFSPRTFFDEDCDKVRVPRPEYYNTRALFVRSRR